MRTTSVVICASMLFSIPCYSGTTTVTDLIRLGLSHSLEVEASQSDVVSLQTSAIRSRLGENPVLSFEGGRRDKQGGAAQQLRVAVAQPLNFGRTAKLGAIADLNTRIGEAELASSNLTLHARLYRDIYRFVAADEKTLHAEERVSRFKEIKKFLSSRTFVSPQKKAEAMIVEGKIQILQKEFLHLRAERDVLWESLNTYFAMSERPKVNVRWFRDTPVLDFKILLARIESQNPSLKINQAMVDRADIAGALARSERWRGTAISGYYAGETGFDAEKNYGIGISFPLPVFDSGSSSIKIAELEKETATIRAKAARVKMEGELRSALIRYNAAREAVAAVPMSSLRPLESSMLAADHGFRRGQVDLLTYIEAENQHSDGIGVVFDAQAELADELAKLSVLSGDVRLMEEK